MAEPVRAALVNVRRALIEQTEIATRTVGIAANSYARHVLIEPIIRDTSTAPRFFTLDIRPPDTHAPADVVLSIAWRSATANPPGTRSQLILRDSLACIVRRGNRGIGDRFPLSAFLQAEHVAVSAELAGPSDVDAALPALGKSRRVALSVPDFVSAAWVVSRTDLLAVVPWRLAQLLARQLGLGILSLPFDVPDLALDLSWPRSSEDDSIAMWLKEKILESQQQVPGSSRE
jgi:DNA-binding transcriptional LysR family regulator